MSKKTEKILIIEDDYAVIDLLKTLIEQAGFESDSATDGQSGVEKALGNEYRLVMLDNGLSKLEGIEVCKRIKQGKPQLPIIMLTSNNDELHKVLMLELGADDYVTKPFSPLELKARIKAVLRRTAPGGQSTPCEQIVEVGKLKIDLAKRQLWLDGEEIHLTFHEFEILAVLAQKPGHPFSRDSILEALHGNAPESYISGMSSHITRIRAKVEPDQKNPRYILTVRGLGYKLADRELDELEQSE